MPTRGLDLGEVHVDGVGVGRVRSDVAVSRGGGRGHVATVRKRVGRDHDMLQVEQVGVLRGRNDRAGRIHQPSLITTTPLVVPVADTVADTAVDAGAAADMAAAGEDREDPAAAQCPSREEPEPVVCLGAVEVHDREIRQISTLSPVGQHASSIGWDMAAHRVRDVGGNGRDVRSGGLVVIRAAQ
jgi:hypothetical protein